MKRLAVLAVLAAAPLLGGCAFDDQYREEVRVGRENLAAAEILLAEARRDAEELRAELETSDDPASAEAAETAATASKTLGKVEREVGRVAAAAAELGDALDAQPDDG
jgi:uncharacterized protein (DUF3084 family)